MPVKAGTQGGPALRLRPWAPRLRGVTKKEELGTICLVQSAFPSSSRVNWWLCFKRLFQALASRAGGTAVIARVDHTPMRGSEPHDR